MACLSVSHSRSPQKHRPISVFFKEKTLWYDTFRELAVLNLPLTLNRILLNVLHSIESALLPGCLVTSGLSRKAALSQYGILTGMALPMIFFPSAITHAVSVMLLPGVAKQQADGTPEQISDTIRYTISFCVLLGTSAVFAFFFLIRLFILYPPANLLRQLRNSQIPRPALRLQDGGASAFPCQRHFSCQSRKGTCTSGVW